MASCGESRCLVNERLVNERPDNESLVRKGESGCDGY
jgi:hypothetical protein